MNIGCVECHQFRGETLPGTVGIELQGVAGRVHPNWFQEFLHDPASLKPRTRMPTFFPNGKSQNPDVLNGDTERQIAAMWSYLKAIDKLELPEKIKQARSQDYEMVPKDRPLILRTFMDKAGMHAIAVGFPQRVHFAFDAEKCSRAQAWGGRFLDAQGTWFERFAPPADPLGDADLTTAGCSASDAETDTNKLDDRRCASTGRLSIPADIGSTGSRYPDFLYQVGDI